MKLKQAKLRYKEISMPSTKAVNVLHTKMHVYNKEAREILTYLVEQVKIQNKNSPALKALYQLMDKADTIAIDCAHKLAPYQDPKLNTIEVKNKVEHRFVMRAPQQVATVEEWMKKTGATKATSVIKQAKEIVQLEPETMVQDYDSEDDELATIAELNKHTIN